MKLAIATATARNARHWTSSEISWDDLRGWMEKPFSRKDCGNYLLGTLKGSLRSNTNIVSRSALTLDVDSPNAGFRESFELTAGFKYLAHTTFSSAPDAPRYRLIIPTDREMLPDEYTAAASAFANRFGPDQFDPSGVKPAQYMFRPSASRREWFEWWEGDGPLLAVDDLLADFPEDLSAAPVPKKHHSKRDPYEIEGLAGAFNRAYADDWALLIETYGLPYEPAPGDRWHLVGARSEAGMGPMAPGLVYSHHSHDPAAGVACSAFDLVRLHRYGGLDEDADRKTPVNRLRSYLAMLDDAGADLRVKAQMVGADFDAIVSNIDLDNPDGDPDDEAWKLKLRTRPRTGQFLDCIENWDLIVDHDPVFKLLCYNDMSMAVEATSDLPWRGIERGGPIFTNVDRQQLTFYLERAYSFRPHVYLVDSLVSTAAQRNWVTPVKEYLESLSWDGKARMETCLPGVRPTTFTRLVARKSFVAAVARMFDPGVKYDHVLVLTGTEGRGKTYWANRMAKGFTTTLGAIHEKDTLLALHRSWIVLADEGYSLRKADSDALKEFLTRTEDVFRIPYDRESVPHARRFVFWSTTNDEVFLRRQEGNRRFLVVQCEDSVDFGELTDEYVDQVWAEAVHYYRKGERLYLDEAEARMATPERERYTEDDPLPGLIIEYADTPVPADWEARSPEGRREWMRAYRDGATDPGTERQEQLCSAQVWAEVLGNRVGSHNRVNLLEITKVLKALPGWVALPGRARMTHYGPQLVFVRADTLANDLF